MKSDEGRFSGWRPMPSYEKLKRDNAAMLQALKEAESMLRVSAATAKFKAKVRNEKANLGLAAEITIHADRFLSVIAQAEGEE